MGNLVQNKKVDLLSQFSQLWELQYKKFTSLTCLLCVFLLRELTGTRHPKTPPVITVIISDPLNAKNDERAEGQDKVFSL